jgi:Ca2+-binding RTX toxin-like protein
VNGRAARGRSITGLLLAALVAAFQCAAVFGASVAEASPLCSFSDGTLTLVDDGAGFDYIDVWQDTQGVVFMTIGPSVGVTLPGGICGAGAALSAIDRIDITGGTGASIVAIWMSQVQPGQDPARSTGPGADWGTIDWNIQLGHDPHLDPALIGVNNVLIMDNSLDDPMSVTAGSAGIDLNDDGNLDVVTSGVDGFGMLTRDHVGSSMSAAGGGPTGGPVPQLIIVGGPGDDTIHVGLAQSIGAISLIIGTNGGGGADTMVGGDGRDGLIGGPGDDTISGGDGRDVLVGSNGFDTIDGGSGSDVIEAGPGDDVAAGGKGNDSLIGDRGDDSLSGGEGRDRCDGGPGKDSVDCEIISSSTAILLPASSDRWWHALRSIETS